MQLAHAAKFKQEIPLLFLILKIYPDFASFPFKKDLSGLEKRFSFAFSNFSVEKGKITLNLFELDGEKPHLSKWLEQTLAILESTPVSIGDLIVAVWEHEGGGHFSSEINKSAQAIRNLEIHKGGEVNPFYKNAIATIAVLVIQEIEHRSPTSEHK
jgi:hypothetical protein